MSVDSVRQPTLASSSALEPSAATMRELAHTVAERLIEHLVTLPSQRASDSEGALDAARPFVEPLPEVGTALEPLLELIFGQLLTKGYNTASAGALSFVTGGGIFQAALADFIAAGANPYVTYWAASPGGAQMEQTVVRWFCDLVGFPESAGGVLTSGGSLANLTALITARSLKLGEQFMKGTIYASDQSHHSVQKAARLAGIPAANLRLIASDEACRIRLEELERAIAEDRRSGLSPFLIVGMAGTTGTGAIDDLLGLAAVADREQLWFHVDAAYGGFFAMTQRGRQALRGIERADSIVLDPHKSLFLPFGTGCLLARRVDDLRNSQLLHSHCIRESVELGARDCAINAADLSLELTREFRGLRVWLALKMVGAESFRRCLDEKLDLITFAASELAGIDGIEVLCVPQLSIIAFRVTQTEHDEIRLDALNRRILERINRRGRVHLSSADVRGRYALRICVLAFRTHRQHVVECIEDLRHAMAEGC